MNWWRNAIEVTGSRSVDPYFSIRESGVNVLGCKKCSSRYWWLNLMNNELFVLLSSQPSQGSSELKHISFVDSEII